MMWIDVGIVFLLIIAFGFFYRISGRLRSVHDVASGLVQTIEYLSKVLNGATPTLEHLSQVLNGASQSIDTLKQATDAGQKGLTACIPNAQALNNDLLLLIEHADRLSYRLDELIERASNVEKDLRQTVLVSMRQSEKQLDPDFTATSQDHGPKLQVNSPNDPRDLFVQRVISRYPKDNMPKLYAPTLKSQES